MFARGNTSLPDENIGLIKATDGTARSYFWIRVTPNVCERSYNAKYEKHESVDVLRSMVVSVPENWSVPGYMMVLDSTTADAMVAALPSFQNLSSSRQPRRCSAKCTMPLDPRLGVPIPF
jgi:hypothetical protein